MKNYTYLVYFELNSVPMRIYIGSSFGAAICATARQLERGLNTNIEKIICEDDGETILKPRLVFEEF